LGLLTETLIASIFTLICVNGYASNRHVFVPHIVQMGRKKVEKVVPGAGPSDDGSRKVGADVSDADLKAASADVEGVKEGDLALVLRSDGKWTYGKLKKRTPTDMEFIVADTGATKLFPKEWYCDLKQLVEPEPQDDEEAAESLVALNSHDRWKHVEEAMHEMHDRPPPDLSLYFTSVLRDDKVADCQTALKETHKALNKCRVQYQTTFFEHLPDAEEENKPSLQKKADELALKVCVGPVQTPHHSLSSHRWKSLKLKK
jgi:hypothetical protein